MTVSECPGNLETSLHVLVDQSSTLACSLKEALHEVAIYSPSCEVETEMIS